MIWLEHLLLLSMLQHESDRWTWGRYIIVHPRANTNVSEAINDYSEMLADHATFTFVTIEDLFAAKTLPASTNAALRRRYLL